MPRITTIAALSLSLAAASASLAGDEDVLTIGSKAPAFDIEHWVKGKQIEKFEEGKVYVLEFWATWCGPCVAAMPHLSELQAKYKDYGVTFLGVSDEPLETVEKFLTQTYKGDGKLQDDRTRYTLTTDPDESIWKDYFRAAGRTGIPCTFIVGKTGLVEFIGHPMRMDKALEGVVRDSWDREKFKVGYEAEMKVTRLQSKAFEAQQEEDWDTAIEIYQKMLELDPDNLNTVYSMMNILLVNKKDYEAGYAMARKLVESNKEDANLLNTIAWTIATDEGIEKRDLELAMDATRMSNSLTEFKNAMFLDTLARVYYEQGHLEKAIKWQEKAVEMLDDEDNPTYEGIREALKKYRQEAK